MKVLSVNVGLPIRVLFNGQTVTTGIFKDPVKRPVMVRKLNLDGDRQADLTVHWWSGQGSVFLSQRTLLLLEPSIFQSGFCMGNVR